MGVPMRASGEEEAQPERLSQLALAPSSSNAIPGMGI